MSPTSLEDLDRRQQRKVITRSALRILVSVILLFVLYGALPAADRTGIGTLLELLVGLVIFGALLAGRSSRSWGPSIRSCGQPRHWRSRFQWC